MGERTTIEGFFAARTGTVSYVLWDNATRRAAVIDPVLDFDAKSARTTTTGVDALCACIAAHGLGGRLAMRIIAATGKGPKDQIPSIGCSMKWKEVA